MNICKTCNQVAKCPETYMLHEQCEACVEAHNDSIYTVSVQSDVRLYHGHGDDDAVS